MKLNKQHDHWLEFSTFDSYRKKRQQLVELIKSNPKSEDDSDMSIWISLLHRLPKAWVRYEGDDRTVEVGVIITVSAIDDIAQHTIDYRDLAWLDRIFLTQGGEKEVRPEEEVEIYFYKYVFDSVQLAVESIFSMADSIQSIAQGQPLLRQMGLRKLDSSINCLDKGDSMSALILADDGLELVLRSRCLATGDDPENMRNTKGEKFEKWSFSDYVEDLWRKKVISDENRTNCYTIHEWTNLVHHRGFPPDPKEVRRLVEMIRGIAEL